MRADPADSWPRRGTVCVALAALVFASRAWLIQAWGSPVPFWDQWDAEAIALYRPWLDGTWRWMDLFRAHNEHRIALTRLADLGLFVALGGWNTWAQLLLNALLHAATAASLAIVFGPALARRARIGFVLGLAVLFTAISGWQNALWGFQSQVYFGNVLAVVALAGLAGGAPFDRRWWGGWAAAGLALFATGGGVLVSVAAIGAMGLALVRPRSWSGVLALAAVVALGAVLHVAPASQAALHAQTAGQFFAVFSRCLAWPFVEQGAWCLVLQLPLIILVLMRWRTRTSLDAAERVALALGLLTVLHAAAVAYSRGAGLIDARPLSRYQDPLLLGAAAQWFAALRVASTGGRALRFKPLLWGAALALGLAALTLTNLSLNLRFKREQDAASLAQVRDYLALHDTTAFSRDPRFPGPHPDAKVVQRVLDDPILRPRLPAALFAGASESPTPWIIAHGAALTALAGAAFAVALAWPARKLDSHRPHAPMPAEPRP